MKDLDGEWVGQFGSVEPLGHPLVCSNDGGCTNKLRMVRAASTHFPKLRKFSLNCTLLSEAMCMFLEIDQHLCTGNVNLSWRFEAYQVS